MMTADRLRTAAPYLFYAAIAAWYCAPLFASPNGLGTHDWDQHLFYYGSVIKSVVEYGQLPFWNPWYCGGNVLWQNPQIPLLSPVFPLSLVMSLPTTGPMLLGALKTQDVNLAATFLLFVAVLTVIGMLISDLALAALDPRIRFGATSEK